MNRKTCLAGAAIAALVLSGFVLAGENGESKEQKTKAGAGADSLPAAVLKAAQAAVPAATIRETEQEMEDGTLIYEVEMHTTDGREIEVAVSADGTVLEVEEKVAEGDLPAGVRKTLTHVLPGGRTGELERKTVTLFEVEKEIEGRSYELLMDASGRVLSLHVEHADGEDEGED